MLQAHKFGGAALGVLRFLLQIGLHHAAQFREVRVGALPVKKRAAQLRLQHLDGAGDRAARTHCDASAARVKFSGSIDMATALHPQTILATHYGTSPSPILTVFQCASRRR